MLWAGAPLAYGQQSGVLVARRGRIPRLPGVAGDIAADDQGVGVLSAGDPLAYRQQGRVLVARSGRIARPPV